MFSIPSQVIDQILIPSLLRFLLVGGCFSFLIGIGLILRSEQVFRFSDKMNRWVSGRRATRALEIPRDCWPLVLRYRYPLSAFITIGAVYATIQLLTQADVETIVPGISNSLHLPRLFISWILTSIKWFLLLGCAVSIAVGLMLGFFITTLSKIEKLSGTWISTRNNTFGRKANTLHKGFDNMVTSFPKTAGWIVTILSMVEVTLIGMRIY